MEANCIQMVLQRRCDRTPFDSTGAPGEGVLRFVFRVSDFGRDGLLLMNLRGKWKFFLLSAALATRHCGSTKPPIR